MCVKGGFDKIKKIHIICLERRDYMNLTLEQAYNKYLEYANLKLKPTTLLTFKRNVEFYIN